MVHAINEAVDPIDTPKAMNGSSSQDTRPVFFFDIDNTVCASPHSLAAVTHQGLHQLYPRSKRVHHLMQDLINQYFTTHLSLSPEAATHLNQTYYQQYGLALEGLVRHHEIDPLEYNALVDDALPLEDILAPSPHLRNFLLSLDRSKVKPWLFTNAYVNHGKRVIRLLGIEDCFEGMTYCDYAAKRIICKPHEEMFERARREAGAGAWSDGGRAEHCFFVDDSALNCQKAEELGWTAVHLLEPEDPDPEVKAAKYQVRGLEELRELFPQFFLPDGHAQSGSSSVVDGAHTP
jgi:pyrimidine and pyridine-specific 5'-nucleotidase